AYDVSHKRHVQDQARKRVLLAQNADETAFLSRLDIELATSVFAPGGPSSVKPAPGGPWTRFRRVVDRWGFRAVRWLPLPSSWTDWYVRKSIFHSVMGDIQHQENVAQSHRQALQKALGERPEQRVIALRAIAQTGHLGQERESMLILDT